MRERRESARQNRVTGFTLLEVLISIMILVMAVATILPLFAVGMTSHKRGIDQAHLAWLAPRIAARVQEQFYSAQPREIRGYVKETQDGGLLLDDVAGKLPAQDVSTYVFTAKFTPVTAGAQSGLVANAAYHLEVTLNYLDAGADQAEVFHTVVLRRLAR